MSALEIGLVIIIIALAGAAVWYTLRTTSSATPDGTGSGAAGGGGGAVVVQKSDAVKGSATPEQIQAQQAALSTYVESLNVNHGVH